MVFPPIWGEKWRRSEHAHASYPGLFFRPARVQPLYGAGRKGSSGTGLHITQLGILMRYKARSPPSYFDVSGTSNAMFDELAERPLMSPLAGMKHSYVRLAIVIFSHHSIML